MRSLMPDHEPDEWTDDEDIPWDCDLSYDLPNLSEWEDENEDDE